MIKLALVGRPNVGKSLLFNKICKKRLSIVDSEEGVTRDRLYAEADFFGHSFQVIDTAGIDPLSSNPFREEVFRQSSLAIEEADILILVVDGKSGPSELDREIATMLFRSKKPFLLAVNKIDSEEQEYLLHPFHSLGVKKMTAISAAQNWRIAELLEDAFEKVEWKEEEKEEQETLKVAIVGRPNVGKSTLLNTLLHEERSVTSPIAGTTRDTIDAILNTKDRSYRLIDTAGIRKKNKESSVIDKFAALRTKTAIERSEICLLVMEAKMGVTAQDKKIAREIEQKGKGCLLLFNKWDEVKGFRMEHCLQSVKEELPFLRHCPTLFLSAKTGRNVEKIFSSMVKVEKDWNLRLSTGELNQFVEGCLQKYHPPMMMGKRLRIYYLTQIAIRPPRFVLFVNDPSLMVESYQKYLVNQFRETFGYAGVPLVFDLRSKRERR